TLAAEAPKLTCAGAGNDDVGFLRLPVLEYSGPLEHEAARLPGQLPDDALEPDEGGRAVAAVHHQVFDVPLARDVTRERPRDGGARQLGQVLTLAVRLLVPALDGESGVRNILHVSTSP